MLKLFSFLLINTIIFSTAHATDASEVIEGTELFRRIHLAFLTSYKEGKPEHSSYVISLEKKTSIRSRNKSAPELRYAHVDLRTGDLKKLHEIMSLNHKFSDVTAERFGRLSSLVGIRISSCEEESKSIDIVITSTKIKKQ